MVRAVGVLSPCGLAGRSSVLSSEFSPFTLHVNTDWKSKHNKNSTPHPLRKGDTLHEQLQLHHLATHRRSFIVPDWMHFQINSHCLRRGKVLVGHLSQRLRYRQFLLGQQHLTRLHCQGLDRVKGKSLKGCWGVLGQPGEYQRRRGRRRLALTLGDRGSTLGSGHQRRRLRLNGASWD